MKERRRHVVYLTRNTEYHCRSRECVGVRDRQSGTWQRWHHALRARLVGAIGVDRQLQSDVEVHKAATGAFEVKTGLRLIFCGAQTILTSPLQSTARPDRIALESYASLCASGEIAS